MAFRVFLLDIEGTTTPIDFVTRTLFPYARQKIDDFAPTEEEYELLSAEREEDVRQGLEPPVLGPDYLHWLMDQDRKSTGLKSLQGRIWEQGYERGELVGEVFDDVLPAIERWRAGGAVVAIFSSGSVLAQKLIFGYSNRGDLRSLISDYFDTTTGPKREKKSYKLIAQSLKVEPAEVCFLSDIPEEIAAAREAGMTACLVVRGDEEIWEFPARVSSFDQILN